MPPAILFPSEETLRLALSSALIPPEVQASAASYSRMPGGALRVRPARELSEPTLDGLKALGVTPSEEGGAETAVSCWAEVVAARRAVEPERLGTVLFVLPSAEGVLPLSGELVRLGCDRQELRLLQSGSRSVALLRVHEPPYFTVARALEAPEEHRAFVPTPPSQDRLWIELGYEHPLAASVRPAPGTLALIPGQGAWLTFDDGEWTDLYQLTDLELPGPKQQWHPLPSLPRLRVTPRLVRAARAAPASLWVLREDAAQGVERLARELSDELLARLSFAVARPAGGSGPCVVLRARPSREGPPPIAVGEAYSSLFELANLFAPTGLAIEPPLRRDRLRELLAADPDRVSWLAPLEGGGFRVESLAESAFHPLSEWVDYLVDSGASTLEAWVKGVTFELEPFEVAEPAPSPKPEAVAAPRPKRRSKPREEPPRPAPPRTEDPPEPRTILEPKPLAVEVSAVEVRLAELESRFLELTSPGDAPERLALWEQLAGLNEQLSRTREAALCWTRALWEASGQEAAELAVRWSRAEPLGEGGLSAALERPAPKPSEVRAVAAELARLWLSGGSTDEAHRAQRWLDLHDGALDVRSLWLARVALAGFSGGDPLGLARARDRVLAQLHRGLSVERDVPRFLRFTGARGRDPGTVTKLIAQLEALFGRFVKTQRKRKVLEAPLELTRAYVTLIFAYGFARLGQSERARALCASAIGALDLTDPVHGFLAPAYRARVEQALEGRPPDMPLPHALSGRLAALEGLNRFKVDRLRQCSSVLEPQERLDPFGGFVRRGDPGGDPLAALRGLSDVERLASEVESLWRAAAAEETAPDERARLIDGLMDFLPPLPEAQATPLLSAMVERIEELPLTQRTAALEGALRVAGHFQHAALVKQLTSALHRLFGALDPEHAAEAGRALGACLRSLRRVGLREEAAGLLEAAERATQGTGLKPLLARLTLGAGFASLGRLDRATPLFDQAFSVLAEEQGAMADRLALTRAAANALSHSPVDYALGGLARLAQQLPWITDGYNTNSHFCLSVVDFADALVLGHASDDLALGETGRRFLEEDEFLVRRRIHREVAGGGLSAGSR